MHDPNLHRIELLEADIRKWRQSLREVSDSVIAGREDAVPLALRAKIQLGEPYEPGPQRLRLGFF